MKSLLDNRFAPLTFTFGFIEAPLPLYAEAFASWWSKLSIEFDSAPTEGTLGEMLLQLEPLETPPNRYLLLETRSAWTAVFANGLRVNDVAAPVGHLCQTLGCRGLEVRCIPDRSKFAGRDGLQLYGAVVFSLSGPEKTDWLNRIRHISVMNDGGIWIFDQSGKTQQYEDTARYKAKKVVDRFTPEMLESYCAALGISLFDSGFYGPKGVRMFKLKDFPHSPRMSLSEARKHLFLPGSL